jgi:hypothetical protein
MAKKQTKEELAKVLDGPCHIKWGFNRPRRYLTDGVYFPPCSKVFFAAGKVPKRLRDDILGPLRHGFTVTAAKLPSTEKKTKKDKPAAAGEGGETWHTT